LINRNEIQIQACKALLDSKIDDKVRGTIQAITGIGKTFISLMMIEEIKPKSVLFLAESTLREKDVIKDIEKYKDVFGYDILANHHITFACYQSTYKWVSTFYDMVIADEIHDSLTPEYFKYYQNNRYNHLIGLSATIDKKSSFIINGQEVTKIDLLNQIAPIVFTYSIKQGQEDKTARELEISVVIVELDDKKKNIPVDYKDKTTGAKKTFYQTEKDYYTYCHKRFMQAMFSDSEFLKQYWMRKRNEILYNLPSKTESVIALLKTIDLGRTIVFANSITELIKICPTVSSKRTKDINLQVIKDFNDGKLNVIGSFKMLKQGINLDNLDSVVLHSYYGVEKDFIQRVGRLRNRPQKGNVVIFCTRGTQEETWLNKIIEATGLKFNTYNNIKDYVSFFNRR